MAESWPTPVLAAASNVTTALAGPTGLRMGSPYSWTTPNYWLLEPTTGAVGFLSEGGPGQVPWPEVCGEEAGRH